MLTNYFKFLRAKYFTWIALATLVPVVGYWYGFMSALGINGYAFDPTPPSFMRGIHSVWVLLFHTVMVYLLTTDTRLFRAEAREQANAEIRLEEKFFPGGFSSEDKQFIAAVKQGGVIIHRDHPPERIVESGESDATPIVAVDDTSIFLEVVQADLDAATLKRGKLVLANAESALGDGSAKDIQALLLAAGVTGTQVGDDSDGVKQLQLWIEVVLTGLFWAYLVSLATTSNWFLLASVVGGCLFGFILSKSEVMLGRQVRAYVPYFVAISIGLFASYQGRTRAGMPFDVAGALLESGESVIGELLLDTKDTIVIRLEDGKLAYVSRDDTRGLTVKPVGR